MWSRHGRKIFWILLLLEASLIVVNGAMTPVSLGDESHHFRFAENIYNTGKRAPFDPLYESGNPPGFFNNDPPLWHFGLAFLWKLTGGISQTIAQFYHIIFLILLIWITSLLAKEFTGKEEGGWSSALIIATVPMVVTFSTLLYMDVPMTALSALGFYLILKKRYIEAGVASGLAYFTKLNSGFLFPGFVLLIAWNERRKIWSLFKNVFFFTFPILVIYILDLYWRKQNISPKADHLNVEQLLGRASKIISEGRGIEYLISYTTNPADLVKYFGLAFLCVFFFHLFRVKRWNRKDAVLWVPVISYLMVFLFLFGIGSDIRYLLPVLPYLAVLITPSFLTLRKLWHFIIIGICILQFAGTSYYVHQRRQISTEVKEGFEYIRKNVNEDALILYPEENLLIYGQRRIIWSAVRGYGRIGAKGGLYGIFWGGDNWGGDNRDVCDLLKINRIDHILVKKSRIFDDSKKRHLGGYPQSFVENLPHLNGWVKVFENQGMVLWKKMPS
jgi:4-amino-4-deoxy-L-arabinose transferase-like glycosyltransferase